MPAPRTLVRQTSNGGYEAELSCSGAVYLVGDLGSRELADLVADVLAVKHAVDTGYDPSDLVLHTQAGTPRLALTEQARSVVGRTPLLRLIWQIVDASEPLPVSWFKADSADELMLAAARRGHTCLVQLLLLLAPDTANAGVRGERPLQQAASKGRVAVVRLLLEAAPAAAGEANWQGYTALHHSRGTGITRLLLAAAPESASALTDEDTMPLHDLVYGASKATLHMLLAAAPQAATWPGAYGRLPIHEACWAGRLAAVRVLLAAAPETAAATADSKYAPLHFAVMSERRLPEVLAVTRRLLAAAPQTASAVTDEAETPLHLAVRHGRDEVAAAVAPLLLAAAPQSAAAVDHKGFTAFQLALGADPGDSSDSDDSDGEEGSGSAAAAEDRQVARLRPSAARCLLQFETAANALSAIAAAGTAAAFLFADAVIAHLPLGNAEWALVPDPCPGLARALPAALSCLDEQALQVVRRLPGAERDGLQTGLLALARVAREADVELPREAWRLIAAQAV